MRSFVKWSLLLLWIVWITPRAFGQQLIPDSDQSTICLTPTEYEQLKEATKQRAKEAAEKAVAEAVTAQKVKIAGLESQVSDWKAKWLQEHMDRLESDKEVQQKSQTLIWLLVAVPVALLTGVIIGYSTSAD